MSSINFLRNLIENMIFLDPSGIESHNNLSHLWYELPDQKNYRYAKHLTNFIPDHSPRKAPRPYI